MVTGIDQTRSGGGLCAGNEDGDRRKQEHGPKRTLSIKQPLRDPVPGVDTDARPEHADDERRHYAERGAEPPADGASEGGSKKCEDAAHVMAWRRGAEDRPQDRRTSSQTDPWRSRQSRSLLSRRRSGAHSPAPTPYRQRAAAWSATRRTCRP